MCVFVFEIRHYKACMHIYMYDLSPSTQIQHVNKNVSSFSFGIGNTLYENLDMYNTLLKFHKLLSELSYVSVTLVLFLFIQIFTKVHFIF